MHCILINEHTVGIFYSGPTAYLGIFRATQMCVIKRGMTVLRINILFLMIIPIKSY